MDDYISRQATIDAADRADYPGLAVELVKAVTDEVIKELIKLPSAERHGNGLTDMVSLVITMIALYAIGAKKKVWQKQTTVRTAEH